MDIQEHYRRLERMYTTARINHFFQPKAEVSEGACTITMDVKEDFFHAAHAMHGCVYFKMLDDAAFFAVNSLVTDGFVLTASFNTHLLRPVLGGSLIAKGKVTFSSQRYWVGEAEVFDEKKRLIASGSGSFLKSRIELNEKVGYL